MVLLDIIICNSPHITYLMAWNHTNHVVPQSMNIITRLDGQYHVMIVFQNVLILRVIFEFLGSN